MKSVFILGLLATLSVAQITRDNNGMSTSSDDSETKTSSTSSDVGKTTLQWPVYSAASTTSSSVDTAFQTWLAVDSTSASSTVYTVSSVPTTFATTYAPAASWTSSTAVPVYNATSSVISIHNSYSSSALTIPATTTKASTTSTKTSSTASAATSAFTGAAVLGREVAYGLGAAAAGLAMLM